MSGLTLEKSAQNPEAVRVRGVATYRKREYRVSMRSLHTGIDRVTIATVAGLCTINRADGGAAPYGARQAIVALAFALIVAGV